MKVLVTGSAGLPGKEVMRLLRERGVRCLGVDTPDFDPTDAPAVHSCVESFSPNVVIHCAGYTDADKAETLPEKCAYVNGFGAMTVARAAVNARAKLLYLSTPQVFSGAGENPFGVSDPYEPKNVFGMSKVQGEDAVRSLLKRYFIVRTDWIYGDGRQDFLRPLIKALREEKELLAASDQFGSPTWARDLARVICDLIETDRYGIWHARSEGFCSRAEFAEMVAKKTGSSCRILPVPTSELPDVPRRPLNLRLTGELPEGIAPMPSVEDALDRCLADMKH